MTADGVGCEGNVASFLVGGLSFRVESCGSMDTRPLSEADGYKWKRIQEELGFTPIELSSWGKDGDSLLCRYPMSMDIKQG